MDRHFLEVGQQVIPRIPEEPTREVAMSQASRPLYELARLAPPLPPLDEADLTYVSFPFSNDDSGAMYRETATRVGTDDYAGASNRVALIIGEGAYPSVLRQIPEETIILLDMSLGENVLTGLTTEALQQNPTLDGWYSHIRDTLHPVGGDAMLTGFGEHLGRQIKLWDEAGYTHALYDSDAYAEAHHLASEKAIVPWHADITDERAMTALGDVLRGLKAHITFMNLTNVLQVDKKFHAAEDYAEILRVLPVTQFAPIMTSSTAARSSVDSAYALGQTGPFFGLDNLAAHGGRTGIFGHGAVKQRQFAHRGDGREAWLDRVLYSMSTKEFDVVTTNPAFRRLAALVLTLTYPGHRHEIGHRLLANNQQETSEQEQ